MALAAAARSRSVGTAQPRCTCGCPGTCTPAARPRPHACASLRPMRRCQAGEQAGGTEGGAPAAATPTTAVAGARGGGGPKMALYFKAEDILTEASPGDVIMEVGRPCRRGASTHHSHAARRGVQFSIMEPQFIHPATIGRRALRHNNPWRLLLRQLRHLRGASAVLAGLGGAGQRAPTTWDRLPPQRRQPTSGHGPAWRCMPSKAVRGRGPSPTPLAPAARLPLPLSRIELARTRRGRRPNPSVPPPPPPPLAGGGFEGQGRRAPRRLSRRRRPRRARGRARLRREAAAGVRSHRGQCDAGRPDMGAGRL
jgi:hypothetical protein